MLERYNTVASGVGVGVGMGVVLVLGSLIGCRSGEAQPPFPELAPVKGVVQRGNTPVAGGGVQFLPQGAAEQNNAFVITGTVAEDGSFTLSTIRTTDRSGEKKAGAPPGQYRVIYMPAVTDQIQATPDRAGPIELPKPVTIQPGDNNLTLQLPQ
ncbi:MAG: hypothetical protein KatS3mg106_614 [Gemmataceae bacterium]|nr:MAG: hypothetical protein KatS3mg106_614 [Gemmataceae bacterium]